MCSSDLATSGQTTFTATYTVGYVNVYLNGVMLAPDDYTATNGTSIVLTTGAVVGDIVDILAWSLSEIPTVDAANVTGTLPAANGGTGITSPGTSGNVLTSNGSAWVSSAPSAPSTPITVNETTVSSNFTISSGQNGFSVGPMTIASGVSVTVATGQRWVVI